MKVSLIAVLAVAMAGCAPDQSTVEPVEPQPAPAAETNAGVTPISPGAGAVSPVTGTEGVQGSGSGLGQSAKNMAREAAAGAGSGSAGSAPPTEASGE